MYRMLSPLIFTLVSACECYRHGTAPQYTRIIGVAGLSQRTVHGISMDTSLDSAAIGYFVPGNHTICVDSWSSFEDVFCGVH